MSTLNSLSTIEQIEAAYLDNMSFEEDRNVTKARAFITACRGLLVMRPTETGSRESHLRLSPEIIAGELNRAVRWLEAYDTGSQSAVGPRVTRGSFEFGRL